MVAAPLIATLALLAGVNAAPTVAGFSPVRRANNPLTGQVFTGTATVYSVLNPGENHGASPGTVNCGSQYSQYSNDAYFVAVAKSVYDRYLNGNSQQISDVCGLCVRIDMGGKTVTAPVVDSCVGCPEENLDFSFGVYKNWDHISSSPSSAKCGILGRESGNSDCNFGPMKWQFVNCDGSGAPPQETTPKTTDSHEPAPETTQEPEPSTTQEPEPSTTSKKAEATGFRPFGGNLLADPTPTSDAPQETEPATTEAASTTESASATDAATTDVATTDAASSAEPSSTADAATTDAATSTTDAATTTTTTAAAGPGNARPKCRVRPDSRRR